MRARTVAKHLTETVTLVAFSLTLLIAAAWQAQAGYGPQGIVQLLHARGYYDVRITDIDDDEYEVLACKHGILYEIEIRPSGRIKDVDKEGRCGPQQYGRKGGAHVHAPYAGVHVGKGSVDVQAPFTGVHVGKHGTHVRAPFVDLHIPRR